MPQPRKYDDPAEKHRAYRRRQKAARLAERDAKGLPPAPPIPTMPSSQRWRGLVETARAALQTTQDEMQEYHDSRSETWQESERGATMTEALADLQSILDSIEELTV